MLTQASLRHLLHLSYLVGIPLLLVGFIIFQATAPRFGPALSPTVARKLWRLFAVLVAVGALVVVGVWVLS